MLQYKVTVLKPQALVSSVLLLQPDFFERKTLVTRLHFSQQCPLCLFYELTKTNFVIYLNMVFLWTVDQSPVKSYLY